MKTVKKHCAQITRVAVVDYSVAKKGLEDDIEHPLDFILEFDYQKKPTKKEVEAARRDSRKALGNNTARNIELLCEACNRDKGDNIQ